MHEVRSAKGDFKGPRIEHLSKRTWFPSWDLPQDLLHRKGASAWQSQAFQGGSHTHTVWLTRGTSLTSLVTHLARLTFCRPALWQRVAQMIQQSGEKRVFVRPMPNHGRGSHLIGAEDMELHVGLKWSQHPHDPSRTPCAKKQLSTGPGTSGLSLTHSLTHSPTVWPDYSSLSDDLNVAPFADLRQAALFIPWALLQRDDFSTAVDARKAYNDFNAHVQVGRQFSTLLYLSLVMVHGCSP